METSGETNVNDEVNQTLKVAGERLKKRNDMQTISVAVNR
jgi:stress response protein YsnF